jgi:uncharacterized membrane protein (DUF485 family)
MGWSMPELAVYPTRQCPRYWRWGLGLILLVMISIGIMLLFCSHIDTILFWGYSLGVPVLIWTISIAFTLTQYIYSALASEQYQQQNHAIVQAWQQWSQCQIPVLGYHLISAEQDTLKALTGEDIALYPYRARPLFHSDNRRQIYWFLDEVMQRLEQQYPTYRYYLSHIYVPAVLMEDRDLTDAIFARWDLRAEPINDYDDVITTAIDNEAELELSLLLVCQYTDIDFYGYSKFVSALLISNASFLTQQQLHAKAWLGRIMQTTLATIAEDIRQLLIYNQLKATDLNRVWVSGIEKAAYQDLSIAINQINLAIIEKNTLRNIDESFAQPSLLTPYFISAIACDASLQQQQPQLIIYYHQQHYYLQLITAQRLRS